MQPFESEGPGFHRPIDMAQLADADLPLGCWLVTPRRGYTHHGIYAGHGQVVHYAGLSQSWRRGPVQVVSLAEFCDGRRLWMKWTPAHRYVGRPAVQRALSRVGENRYRVISNNCEHFCAWCLDGESRSAQVERWLAWPRTAARQMLAGLARFLNPNPRNMVTS